MPKSITVKLDLRENADFHIPMSSRRKYVVAGTDAVYDIKPEEIGGFTGSVDLTVTGLPTGASAVISDSTIAHDETATVTVESTGVDAGTYEFWINSASTTAGDYDWLTVDNADRISDWSKAGVWYGAVKGIPTYPVGITMQNTNAGNPYYINPNGTTDVTAAVNAAISACPNGYAVYVPAGTYRVNSDITFPTAKQVVLRGAGPTLTKFRGYSTSTNIVTMSGGSTGTWVSLTGGLTKYSQAITASSVGGFSANDFILVDEDVDTTYIDAHVPNYMSRGDGGHSFDGGCIAQRNQIVSITGTGPYTINLLRPLYRTYNMAEAPHMTRYDKIKYCGVEDLALEKMTDGANTSHIYMGQAAFCWVKGVECDNSDYNHINMEQAFSCEIRSCYLHHGYHYYSGHTYAVWLFNRTTDCLVEDNIMYYCRHHIAVEYGGQGNVMAYNYGDRIFDDYYPDTDYLCESMHFHGGIPMYNLFEGNSTSHIVSDNALGGAWYNTFLRNHSWGYSLNYAGTGNMLYNKNCIEIQWNSLNNNVIGNVLGLPSFTGYTYQGALSEKLVYSLGADQGEGPIDSRVAATILRHGNYYYSPSGGPDWDGTITSHAIPPSLYLSGKPSWWGSGAWPAIGPDISGYVTDIPAKKRWDAYVVSGDKADLFN